MREIKIRIIKYKFWDKKNKEFLRVLCLADAFKEYERNPDRYIPLQCSDLPDKNGVEICEGDIIEMYQKNNNELALTREVLFSNGSFNIDNSYLLYELEKLYLVNIIVIGNIYENKDLIK